MTEQQYSFELSSYTTINISGNDAHRFLQGQMTVNADTPQTDKAILASLCNPKGRIVSLFHIFKTDNGFQLILPKNIAEQTQSHLKKYAVFFKVDIQIASSDEKIMVLNPPSTSSSIQIAELPLSIQVVTEDDSSIKKSTQGTINETFWYQTLAENKIPWLTAETSEHFLPHNLNLPKLNAIDFKKGCFTGQEVIARMQYKGKLKQHMKLLSSDHPLLLKGKEPLYQKEKKIAEIICSVNLANNKTLCLALIKDSASETAPLNIDGQNDLNLTFI